MTQVIFVLGATCAGKSTFLEAASKAFHTTLGLVEIGKEMRRLFPPEYFKGSAAPTHTEGLALELFQNGIGRHRALGKKVILVDGQPRNPSQVTTIVGWTSRLPDCEFRFLHLFAPIEERKRRAAKRFKDDPASLALAEARIVGDLPALYEVLSMLHDKYPDRVCTCDTSSSEYRPNEAMSIFGG